MFSRPLAAALCLSAVSSACADPGAAARIEARRENAVTSIRAAREVYCTLSPAARAALRRVGKRNAPTGACSGTEDQTRETTQ